MILKKLVVNPEDNKSADATFALTQTQIAALLSFAISYLVDKGFASIEEVTSVEQAATETENEELKQFLTNVPSEALAQA